MAECPTGILVDVCPSPSPEKATNSEFSDFLKTLGIDYASTMCTPLSTVSWNSNKNQLSPGPAITEDDLLTSEVFDFKVPRFEELDQPVLKQDEESLQKSPFQFPILSTDATVDSLNWNVEVCAEAQKVSRRLSLLPALARDVQSCEEHKRSESLSSVGSDNRTYTVLSSVTSSEGDDMVFRSPPPHEDSEDKENNSKQKNDSAVFVPHPDPQEALTPKGVKKIRGPLLRRGTYTLDSDIPTPKNVQRLAAPGSLHNQGSRTLRTNQSVNQDAKITSSTPKMIPRSKSFIRTPQASPRISTFRTESPLASNRRSISLDRTHITHNSSGRFANIGPTAKVDRPSPLLRKALGPKPASRPTTATSTVSTSHSRGPVRATPLGLSVPSHQISRPVLPTYGSTKTTGQLRSSLGQGSSSRQPRQPGSWRQ